MESKLGSGKILKSQTKEVINNVKCYFKKEKNEKRIVVPFEKVTERTATATGVGLTTVRAVCREAKKAAENCRPFPAGSPCKKRHRVSPVTEPDSFTLEAIRRKIHSFYLKGELPSIGRLLSALKTDAENLPSPIFEGSEESLRLIVKNKLGFRYKKVNNRKHLLERSDVVALRHAYLRQVRQLIFDRTVVFIDETWINESHSVPFCWQSDGCIGLKKPPGKGRRLILLHAGTIEAFVPNCMLLFPSKSGLADYHKDMNSEVFHHWFDNNLLKNIPPNSTIIMDNAPYHSVQIEKSPNSNSRKIEMQDWLSTNNIPFHPQMLKAELYELIKLHKPSRKRYVINEKAAAMGHKVIRLPPYHCQFNPIELIWANIKRKVGSQNSTFKLAAVTQLTEAAVNDITADDWKNAVQHVEKLVEEYWHKDGMIETAIEPLIISTNNLHDSDSSSDDESVECVTTS